MPSLHSMKIAAEAFATRTAITRATATAPTTRTFHVGISVVPLTTNASSSDEIDSPITTHCANGVNYCVVCITTAKVLILPSVVPKLGSPSTR